MLAAAELPGVPGANPPSRITAGSVQPLFVAAAVCALGLVIFLVYDFWRQKRVERRQRQRLERFREKRFKQASQVPTVAKGGTGSHR
jgi:hypothetical protein